MAANASKVKAAFDAAASVTLRNSADGTETATVTETAVSLDLLSAAYWDANQVPGGNIRVIFNVISLDKTTGDETYTLSLQVDDALAQNDTPTTIWSLAVTSTGVYEAILDSKTIQNLVTDYSTGSLYIASKVTVAGTTPIINYAAWIETNLDY